MMRGWDNEVSRETVRPIARRLVGKLSREEVAKVCGVCEWEVEQMEREADPKRTALVLQMYRSMKIDGNQ